MSIYLDHAATTPLDHEALAAMHPFLTGEYGNPSSIHAAGQRARMALDEAREQIAAAIGAAPTEVIFTSGGTESDNSAIRGVVEVSSRPSPHIVTTEIEHEAVLETCSRLERNGVAVTRVRPDQECMVSAEAIAEAIHEETVLVSVMHANNETGVIQPVTEIAAVCRQLGVAFHTDAVQTAGSLPIDVDELGVDLLSLSAHKFGGPKGVGAMYVRSGTHWRPQQMGGGQERTRRSGTENVAGILGMAAALTKAHRDLTETAQRVTQLREQLLDRIMRQFPDVVLNGSRDQRLPGNINVSFPGISGEALVTALDREGVMISSGSACASGSTEPSHVLMAIGLSKERAAEAIRITLGSSTSERDIAGAGDIIVATVHRLLPTNAAVSA
jgi:cysteine desulfurase